MVKVRQRLDEIMEAVCEIEGVSPEEIEQVKRKTVVDAIILEAGGDPRTIKKYETYLRRFGYLQPNNQYVYIVKKTNFKKAVRLEEFE